MPFCTLVRPLIMQLFDEHFLKFNTKDNAYLQTAQKIVSSELRNGYVKQLTNTYICIYIQNTLLFLNLITALLVVRFFLKRCFLIRDFNMISFNPVHSQRYRNKATVLAVFIVQI